MSWTGVVIVIQLFFGIVIGMYFLNLLKGQRVQKVSIDREAKKEMDLSLIHISEPTRPY